MKRFIICLGLIIAACQNCAAEAEWLTDFQVALDKAKAENKVVLLDFTGSDWCGWCKRLKGEVFDHPEFESFARANLILVEVDFPRHKAQAPVEKANNEELLRKYHVNGFPTIVLLNAASQEVGRTGYMQGGPSAFIANLERVPGIKHVEGAVASNGSAPTPRPPPAFVPIPPAAPNHYGELALKGISGSKDRRLALINDQTFMVGETAKAKVKDGRIEITCQEIRADSVLIVVDGKPRELVLGQH